jgi:hypothetical protein
MMMKMFSQTWLSNCFMLSWNCKVLEGATEQNLLKAGFYMQIIGYGESVGEWRHKKVSGNNAMQMTKGHNVSSKDYSCEHMS